jgi:thiamine biosynthesis lipoprotein
MAIRYQLSVLFILIILSGPSFSQWRQFSYVAMTTPIELVFWTEDAQQAKAISQEVFKEFDRIEQQMSRYIESSELSRINRLAFKENVIVSPSLFSVLNSAMSVSKLSQGAFDITFASVGYMYDFRKRLKPKNNDIQQNLDLFHYQNVVLDSEKQSIRFTKAGVLIDLGGIAKGYAVDQGTAILKKQGIHYAHLSAGGDMYLLGDKRGAPWIIGVKHPRDDSKQSIVLPLSNTAVSTSGDYERFFIDDQGERVHHILSPNTGKPVKGIMSVTILANNAITSDGLSTAVFVLGVKDGLALINKLKGVDAILIDEFGKVHYSDNLMRPTVH